MAITVDAVYKNGQLKLKKPIVLAEGTAVRVTITPADEDYDPLESVIGICKGGPRDGAENHDKYLYGIPHRRTHTTSSKPRRKRTAKSRRSADA